MIARKIRSRLGSISRNKKTESFRYVIDNIFSYNNEWNKLIYSVMLGHSFEKYTYEQFGQRVITMLTVHFLPQTLI